jgi:hypothetical protein
MNHNTGIVNGATSSPQQNLLRPGSEPQVRNDQNLPSEIEPELRNGGILFVNYISEWLLLQVSSEWMVHLKTDKLKWI